MAKKLTPSQRQALEDVRDFNDPWHRVFGQARHGGWSGVMSVIANGPRPLCRWSTRKRCWLLTAAGARALTTGMVP